MRLVKQALSALDSSPKRIEARFEQALLAAWYPNENTTTFRPRPDAGFELSNLAITMLVWLLTRSWLGLLAARVVATVATKRRKRRIVNRGQRPPVIVVGNLVAGGSGKTPLVIALARALSQRGLKLAILCSGYGGRREGLLELVGDTAACEAWQAGWPDEAILLAMQCACPVIVGRDRNAALTLCLDTQTSLDMVLSDDGLQHRELERAFEIVLIDKRGFGNRKCLPAGPLREPLADRPASDWALIRSHDAIHRPDSDQGAEAGEQGQGAFATTAHDAAIASLARRCYRLPEPGLQVMSHRDWLACSDQSMSLAQFAPQVAGKKLLGIAGIAQPEPLADLFAASGFDIEWIFPGDHRAAELKSLTNPAPSESQDPTESSNKVNDAIVMTAKDAVKYDKLPIPVFVVVQTLCAPEPLCFELERIARGQPTA
jgi:tetraacyldisaccharide 4'-kinase